MFTNFVSIVIFDDQSLGFAPNSGCTNCVTEFEFADLAGNIWNENDLNGLTLFGFGDSTAPSDLGIVIIDVDDIATPLGDGSRLLLIGSANGQLDTTSPSGMSLTGTFRVVPEPDALPLAAMASLAMLACLRRRIPATAAFYKPFTQ